MDGDQSNNSAGGSGAAYVFTAPTIVLTHTFSHITDSKTAGADQFKIVGTYAYSGSPDSVIDPATDGITLSITAFNELPTAARTLTIAANASGWTVSNNNTFFTWTGNGIGGEPWQMTFDDANHVFVIASQKFNLNPGDGTGGNWGTENGGYVVPVMVRIATGNDRVDETDRFRNSLGFNHTVNHGVLRIP